MYSLHTRRMPPRWAMHAGQVAEGGRWWRDLECAIVPFACGEPLDGLGGRKGGHVRDLVRHRASLNDGGLGIRGEARGVAVWPATSGAGVLMPQDTAPRMPPLTVFAQIVRRDNVSDFQPLLSSGGWTFQLNYASGQLGLTRWGVGDHPTTVLGAVPQNVESSVALAWDGTTARFMLNRQFENKSAGNPSNLGTATGFLSYTNWVQGSVNTSVFVCYAWSRVLSDNELLELVDDPWRVVRPQEIPILVGAGGGSPPAGARPRSYVIGFIG